jgi:hypothetical protein
MKFKLLALTLCMAALSSVSLKAQDAKLLPLKYAADSKVVSKDKKSRTYFSASDAAQISLTQSTHAQTLPQIPFVPLTFTTHIHANGKGIKSNGDQFRLSKGIYLVMFTGTFQVAGPEDDVYFDVALQVGSDQLFINSESHESQFFDDTIGVVVPGDSTGISSIFKVIEVKKPTDISIVARNTTSVTALQERGTIVNALTRSLTILKLAD